MKLVMWINKKENLQKSKNGQIWKHTYKVTSNCTSIYTTIFFFIIASNYESSVPLSCDCVVACFTAAVVATVADADVYRSMWFFLQSKPLWFKLLYLLSGKSKSRKLAEDLQVLLTGSAKAIMPLQLVDAKWLCRLGVQLLVLKHYWGAFHSLTPRQLRGLARQEKCLMVFHSRRTLAMFCYLALILDVGWA